MKNSIVVLVLLLSIVLSSCSSNKNIEQEIAETKESVLNEALNIDLSKNYFSDIYSFPDIYFIENVSVFSTDDNHGESTTITIDSQDELNAVDELIWIECQNSTISKVVHTKNNYDYIVDFKMSHSEGDRDFSITIGDSYLLVSLIGETEQIIKHDIAPEDYKMLMDLINIEPEIGLNIVDENIVRVTDHIPIMPNENGDYLKYLVLHDSVLNRIPLLVRIELLVDDLGKKEPILSSIQKSHIEFFGVTSMEVIGEFSDGNYYWEKMFDLSNDEAISTLSSDRMAEVMYLDANYSEVKLWDIFDDVVTYSSSYSINNYKVSIGIGRDPTTEELYLNVRDESD